MTCWPRTSLQAMTPTGRGSERSQPVRSSWASSQVVSAANQGVAKSAHDAPAARAAAANAACRRLDQLSRSKPQKASVRNPRPSRCSAPSRPIASSSDRISGKPVAPWRSVRSTTRALERASVSARRRSVAREMIPSPRQPSSQPGGLVVRARCSRKIDQGWCVRT